LFLASLQVKASDLILSTGVRPTLRINGELRELNMPVLDNDDVRRLLFSVINQRQRVELEENRELDFALSVDFGKELNVPNSRFRVNAFFQRGSLGMVARVVNVKIPTPAQLGLPEVVSGLCGKRQGLVLVTGPTGSGKSTTLAAMIDYINENKSRHIITIEDPIEFVHTNKLSTIIHREVGIHAQSFPKALRGAMRSDPDIVLIGEMRDNETIRLGLTCASMGMLVFATLHTNNAPKTIDRIIDAFPSDEQAQIRTMLAECLQAIVSQLLCRKINGGRVAVHEVLLWADGLPNTIREGQISNIRTIIDAGVGRGMQAMDNSIQEQLEAGNISIEEAYMKASDKNRFIKQLEEEEARHRRQMLMEAKRKK
ncbi:MAG: PilT/PilU family type 4a pilus ATPase, partial [Lentisphaeria bacterium]|nr:PilT/PilU family type 4a pilus ATPase [Lentisphaeria bacterium]